MVVGAGQQQARLPGAGLLGQLLQILEQFLEQESGLGIATLREEQLSGAVTVVEVSAVHAVVHGTINIIVTRIFPGTMRLGVD